MCALLLATMLVARWDAFESFSERVNYPSLVDVQRAARRRELAVGQRVVVSVAQAPVEIERAAEASRAAGALFCVQPQPLVGLPAGVWQCEVRADGRLWPAPPTFGAPLAPSTTTITCPGGACRRPSF